MNRIILGIVCILLSGYAYADVLHPEDPTIRGHFGSFGDDVCFNNDGSSDSVNCPEISSSNEGYTFAIGAEWRTSYSGIYGCGITAVDPVSNAACLFATVGALATCTPNQYVLVKTINNLRYFAIKAGATCGTFSGSEAEVIFPCLTTDAFDPVLGCTGVANQSGLRVDGGYIQLETSTVPPVEHCNDITHRGRMIVDDVNDLLYICTQSGWITK